MFISTTFLQGGTTDHGHRFSNSRALALSFQISHVGRSRRGVLLIGSKQQAEEFLLSGSTTTMISWCAFLPNLVGV